MPRDARRTARGRAARARPSRSRARGGSVAGRRATARRRRASVRSVPAHAAARFSFTLPQLVAAGLALMVLSGGMVWVARLGDPRASLPPVRREPPNPCGRDRRPPVDRRRQLCRRALRRGGRGSREGAATPAAAGSIRKRCGFSKRTCASIDLAIEQSRKALRNDPANVYLNNHFAASRNRKLALLRRASALAMAPDELQAARTRFDRHHDQQTARIARARRRALAAAAPLAAQERGRAHAADRSHRSGGARLAARASATTPARS